MVPVEEENDTARSLVGSLEEGGDGGGIVVLVAAALSETLVDLVPYHREALHKVGGETGTIPIDLSDNTGVVFEAEERRKVSESGVVGVEKRMVDRSGKAYEAGHGTEEEEHFFCPTAPVVVVVIAVVLEEMGKVENETALQVPHGKQVVPARQVKRKRDSIFFLI